MKRITMLLLLFLCGINIALAVRVTTLYQGVLPATTQSADERSQLASAALAQVLVKLSGNNTILNNSEIKARLSTASSLMQEFSYVHAPTLPGQTKPYLLELNFDPEGVNKILRDAGAPIWGQNRPLLLVWLTYQAATHAPEMVGADSSGNISSLLKQSTDRRGIPVMFPALDVEDLGQVTVNDVLTMNSPKLMNAAKRYASDGILMGHITQTPTGYQTEWKLVMGNDQWGWNITGNSLPDIFNALTDHSAETLAGRYATVITNTIQSNLVLKIIHVSEADDFVQVMSYIKHLTPVSDVQLVQINGSELIVKVSLRGTEASFAEALSVGQKLTPVTNEGKQMLVYQWNR